MDLELKHTAHGDTDVIEAIGEIDVYSAPRLREQCIQLASAGRRMLIIDLCQTQYLDATGLGVLVGAKHRLRKYDPDGEVFLVVDDEKVLTVLRMTGLTKVFPIYASQADALEAARQTENTVAP